MTFSILVRDPQTGLLGGAAATGNLCVGGWVLRGDAGTGIAATQGEQPSTLWADRAFARLDRDQEAQHVVDAVVAADAGRARRQMGLVCRSGTAGAFTGAENGDWKGALVAPDLVVAGNLLAGPQVLEAARAAVLEGGGLMVDRLMAGLRAAVAAGGDRRGLMSAALLVVCDTEPPLDLRIDWAADPLAELAALLDRARRPEYARWVAGLPVRTDPNRAG
ncbi:MAG: DUF1028 domain-containing protein [Alkalilacustris sp.]